MVRTLSGHSPQPTTRARPMLLLALMVALTAIAISVALSRMSAAAAW